MNNFLLFVGGLFVVLLGALFAVPIFIDWNSYRGAFEEEASRILGREVRVNGAVSLRLLPAPKVRFEKVRVADVSGQTGEPFFRADSFTLHLSIGALMQGTIEANEVELTRPVLNIAFDEAGRGNWRGFRRPDPKTGFAPSDIVLPSVKITDGTLVLHGIKGDERGRIDGINGDVSAPGIEGPYKARVLFAIGSTPHELRIATAKGEADSSTRLKATIRGTESGTSVAFDGRLDAFLERPRLEGELTAKLGLLAAGAKARAGSTGDAFDLKAKAVVDAAGLDLADLTISFESDGRPQLMTGRLKGAWATATRVEAALAGGWIDLDRLAGQSGETPARLIQRIVSALDALPRSTQVSAIVSIEQASLGADVASNIQLALEQRDRVLTVRELRAILPGGSRLETRGEFTGVDRGDLRYNGEINLRGASLQRTLTWALGSQAAAIAKRDGAFGVRSRLSLSATEVTASHMQAELAGSSLEGAVSYRWVGKTRLDVALEGAEIDGRFIAVTDQRLSRLLQALVPFGARSAGASSAPRPVAIDEIRTRVQAGRLNIGEQALRDVTADVVLEGERLKINVLRLATDDGVHLDVTGQVHSLGERPKGAIGGLLVLPSPQAVASVSQALAIPADWQPDAARAKSVTPLRLALTLSLGERHNESRDLRIDGVANGSRIVAAAKLDLAANDLAAAKVDLTAEATSSEISRLLEQLLPANAAGLAGRFGSGGGRAALKASGALVAGMVALATFEAPGLTAEYTGRLAARPAGIVIDGDVRLDGDATRALMAAGLGARPGLDGLTVKGSAQVAAKDGILTVDGSALKIGPATVSARLRWPGEAAGAGLDLSVRASEASLVGIMSLILDGRSSEGATAGGANAPAIWPETSFDLAALDRAVATIRLDTPRLAIAPELAVRDASVLLRVSGGKLIATLARGRAIGGTVKGELTIARARAGAEVKGSIAIADLNLERLSAAPAQTAPAKGRANVSLLLTGTALSPRGLMAALEGKGHIDLSDARLQRLSPMAITAAVSAALDAKEPMSGADLRRILAARLGLGEIVLGTRRIALEVVEGSVRLADVSAQGEEGKVSGRTTLDLESLRLDSEWRLETSKQYGTGAKRSAPPPIAVLLAGPVGALDRFEPEVRSDALERVVAVWRVERAVEELERLRREGEERARQDIERQQQKQGEPEKGVPGAPPEKSGEGAAPAPAPASAKASVVAPPDPPPVAAEPAGKQAEALQPPAPPGPPGPPAQPAPKLAPAPEPRPAVKRPPMPSPFGQDRGG